MMTILVIVGSIACGAPQQTEPVPARHVVRAREPICADDGDILGPTRVLRHLDTDETTQEVGSTAPLFLVPVDAPEVTSPFGVRRDPLDRSRRRMHRGTDFRGSVGTPVYATAPGRALMAGYCDRGTGNCVVLEHADGWRSQYFHLSAVHISAGAEVSGGDHIGDIGSTGRSTGPHLHFQLSKDGVAVDPMEIIVGDRVDSGPSTETGPP